MDDTYVNIARRIAEIANYHAQILNAQEYDVPDDLQEAITKAAEAKGVDKWDVEDEVRAQFAKDYLERELAKFKDETAKAGIVIDTLLVEALLPSIGEVTHWESSSYGC